MGHMLHSRTGRKRNKEARAQAKQRKSATHAAHIVCPHGHETKRYVSDRACASCRAERRSNQDYYWDYFRKKAKPAMDTLYEQLTAPRQHTRNTARAALERLRDTHKFLRVRKYAKELLDRFDEQHSIPESDN